jgi:hypothetical protein
MNRDTASRRRSICREQRDGRPFIARLAILEIPEWKMSMVFVREKMRLAVGW